MYGQTGSSATGRVQQGTSRISRHSKTKLLHTDLGLDLHNSLSNCDNHSLIGQHAFQVVQQLLQSCHKAAKIVFVAFGSHPIGSHSSAPHTTFSVILVQSFIFSISHYSVQTFFLCFSLPSFSSLIKGLYCFMYYYETNKR